MKIINKIILLTNIRCNKVNTWFDQNFDWTFQKNIEMFGSSHGMMIWSVHFSIFSLLHWHCSLNYQNKMFCLKIQQCLDAFFTASKTSIIEFRSTPFALEELSENKQQNRKKADEIVTNKNNAFCIFSDGKQ